MEARAVGWSDCYKAHGTVVSGGAVRDAWCLGRRGAQPAAGVGSKVEAHVIGGMVGKERSQDWILGQGLPSILFPRCSIIRCF